MCLSRKYMAMTRIKFILRNAAPMRLSLSIFPQEWLMSTHLSLKYSDKSLKVLSLTPQRVLRITSASLFPIASVLIRYN